MFVVRDTFKLKFGQFKDAFALIKASAHEGVFPADEIRVLSDFTGDAYRLVFEMSFPSLADYENQMINSMSKPEFQKFYSVFKTYIVESHREIMREHAIK